MEKDIRAEEVLHLPVIRINLFYILKLDFLLSTKKAFTVSLVS